MRTTVEIKNLTFSDALIHLKDGKFIRVPEWRGYWHLKGGKIMVKTWDNQDLDTPWLNETVLREDWQVVTVDNKDEIEEFKKAMLS